MGIEKDKSAHNQTILGGVMGLSSKLQHQRQTVATNEKTKVLITPLSRQASAKSYFD